MGPCHFFSLFAVTMLFPSDNTGGFGKDVYILDLYIYIYVYTGICTFFLSSCNKMFTMNHFLPYAIFLEMKLSTSKNASYDCV